MLRIHKDTFVPKYVSGKWVWNAREERIVFEARKDATLVRDESIKTGGFKFKLKTNQIEEIIFRQEFQRPDNSHDADVILIQDIRNLVLYLAPKQFMTIELVRFMHTRIVHRLLHALIIYFEYYLKMVEFVLIRRDEISGDEALIQSEESNVIKRIYSAYLTQYRLLVAREYSLILLGHDEMAPYHHLKPIVNFSQSIKDKAFHEAFQALCTQIVWIAMHRRAYEMIDMEMGRLFRSEHFKLTYNETVKFSIAEASMLYGKNYTRVNYRAQNSPLVQELANVSLENLPILWIGVRKYRGSDYRIHQLELEFIVPDSQLALIDITHGILGHPKKIYDTLLHINWEAVRFQNYSERYDPYRIIRQPYMEMPRLDAEKIRKHAETYESYYNIVYRRPRLSSRMLRKWIERDRILHYYKTEGVVTDTWVKCEREISDNTYGPSVQEITAKFIENKRKLRKK